MGEIAGAVGRAAKAVPAPAGQLVPVAQHQADMEQAKSQYENSLNAKKAYAALLAASGLLPKAYQRNPANVLFAMEYGQALGLSPVQIMLGIFVIDGKPTASAGLIQGLVRRAGHKLRLRGNDQSATCEIIRADDPEYTFSFTWTMERARQAGLTSKDNWRKTPAAMLQARATTECARAACQDALFGLAYTPEELGSELPDGEWDGVIVPEQPAVVSPLEVLNEELDRLGVPSERKLQVCSVLADKELVSSEDLEPDEIEFVTTELAGCESPEALDALLAERQEIE